MFWETEGFGFIKSLMPMGLWHYLVLLSFLGSKYLASNKNGYRKMGRGGVRLETLELHFSRLSIILYKKIFFIIKPSAHLEGTTSQRKKLTVLCSGECFPDAPVVKTTPAMQGTQPPPLGLEEPLQKERATHSSIPAWEIPRTKETAGLQGMGSRRAGHQWAAEQQHVYRSTGLLPCHCMEHECHSKITALLMHFLF